MGDRDRSSGARVYVGGLRDGIKKEDLEGEFEKFGELNNVWIALNPPGFAFIEFNNLTDAESACENLNGTELLGSKLIVEIAKGRSRRGGFRGGRGGRGGPRGGGNGGGFYEGDRGFRGGRFDGERRGGGRGGGGGFRGRRSDGDRFGGSDFRSGGAPYSSGQRRPGPPRRFGSGGGGGGGEQSYRSRSPMGGQRY